MLKHEQFLRSLSSFLVYGCPLLTDSGVHLEAESAAVWDVRLSAFKDSFKTSKQLQLKSIEDHNLVPEAKEDGLNGVTSLELLNCKDLECLVDTTTTATKNGPTSAFTHLETLYMEKMDGLEALCKGQPPQGFLKNLKHLNLIRFPELRWIFKGSPHSFTLQSLKVVKIYECGKLKSLFSSSLIQSLVLLEQLKIECCDELETLFADPENDGEIESKHSSLPLHLPKLNTLCIKKCSKLEYVVPQNYIVKAPSLKRMKVKDCSKVMNLPIQQANNQLELTL
ncbi:hypothetical protein PVK06_000459 [Gossypium arboreum]|uniref:Disease resistance protein At4g27190-like leucine-rich repeats domain-containing protein n=1 Tax=Gossypium arboreum TaxID=29729 RepID=A0ABR0QZA5_GOSAR|nr:hypothetical protein PVK06_000459 [Gossypium arboreum]